MELLTMIILYATIALVPLFYLFYRLSVRKFSYWSDRGVKGPTPTLFFGNLIELFWKEKRQEEINMLKKYGNIYGVYNGNSPVITVAEPELIKNILVKDFHLFTDRAMPLYFKNHPILSKHLGFVEAKDWKRIRSIISPAFTSGKMRKMYPLVKECLKEFFEVLDRYAEEGRPVDMKFMYGNYAMDTMGSCVFATKTNVFKDAESPFRANTMKIHNPDPWRLIPLMIFPTFLIKLLGIKYSSDESANEFYFNLTRHVMNDRKNKEGKYNDFIQLILNAQKNGNQTKEVVRDEEDLNESHHVNEGEEELAAEQKMISSVTNKYLTEDEILAASWGFFNAGFENTSTIMATASYELALNQDIQQRLYEEVITAVDANGDIDYDLLSRLPYLDSVVSETLRLHSFATRIQRKAAEDYKLGTTGITIEKGHCVEIPTHAIHHSEQFYDHAHIFNPDRFMPENRRKLTPYTYLPFGGGPRNCIGMRFVLMDIKLGLAQVLKRYKMIKHHLTDIPLVYSRTPGINGLKRTILVIEKRN